MLNDVHISYLINSSYISVETIRTTQITLPDGTKQDGRDVIYISMLVISIVVGAALFLISLVILLHQFV